MCDRNNVCFALRSTHSHITTSTTTSTTATATPAAKDETAGWLTFTNSVNGYSMKIPDGWVLSYYSNTGYLTSLDTNNDVNHTPNTISYKAGTIAKVNTAETGAFANFLAEFSIASDNQIDKTNSNWAATKVGSVDLGSGTAEKHHYSPAQDPNLASDKTNQSADVYYFTKNGKDLYATYVRNVGTGDISALVEKALKTLK